MPIRADRTSLTTPASAPTSSSGRARTIGPTARPGAVAPATATPALVGALGVTPAQSRALASRSRPGRLPGPLNFIITAASVPAYGVGQAILHPFDRSTYTSSGIDFFRDEKKHTYPGQALRQQGALNFIPKAYGLRSTAAFLGDVALDPLTYVTFGGGAAVGAGGKSLAKGAAIKGIEDAIAAGEKVTTKQIAQATAADFLERAALPTTAKINFRVPLSRSRDIPIWQSSAIPKAARAVKSKIPAAGNEAGDTLARLIGTNRGIHPLVKEVYENTRRFSSNLERMNATAAKELDDTITSIAKDAKIDVKQANKEIALHLDNPTAYPLRPELQAGADAARAFRDPLTAEDLKAGTLTDEILVGEYFPHMADSAKGARALRNWRGQRSADKLYDPAFTKERGAKDLDAFAAAGEKHGFTPEFNVARALEARGMASIKARQVRAITDTLEEFVGVKPPPRIAEKEMARLEGAKAAAADVAARLRELTIVRPSAASPTERGGSIVSERGAANMQRYFDSPPPEASPLTPEIQDALRKADRRVSRAQADVRRAQRKGDTGTLKRARRRLERAQTAARDARTALDASASGAVGTPREIVSATKEMLRAEKRFARAESDLTAVDRLNTLLDQKPARPTTPEEWKALGEEWAYVKEGTAKNKGVKVPADVREGLDEVHKLIQPLLNDDAMRVAGRFITGFTSRWKVLALLTPGYHVRNQIDDGIRSFMAGARNPRSFEQSARILRGGIEGASGSATIRIGKKVYTHDQYLARARAYGVIDAGFVRTEVMSSGQTEIRRTWHGLHSPGRGRAAQASSTFGNYRENVNRLGLFMELEKSGRSPLVAARRTREFLIDYGEVGAFVDNARKFIFPFITYTSKVLPLFARELARHPGFFSHYGAATGALTEAAGNPDLSQLQAWNRSSFAVPLPGAIARGIGVPNTPIVNPNGLLGVGTLDMLDPTSKTRAWSTVVGSLANPLIRAPINIGTGTNAYFGSNLSRLATAPGFIKFLAEAGVPVPTYVPPGGKPGEKGKTDFMGRPVPGYSSYLNEILGILPVFNQGARVSNPDSDSRRNAIVKLGLGLPISDYDAEKQRGFAAKNQGK